MTRIEPERTAKRVRRIDTAMTALEQKGRTADPHYRKCAQELEDHISQILDSVEEAENTLRRTQRGAAQSRKRIKEERAELDRDKSEFYAMRDRETAAIKEGLENIRSQIERLEQSRRELGTLRDETLAAKRRYEDAVQTFRSGLIADD